MTIPSRYQTPLPVISAAETILYLNKLLQRYRRAEEKGGTVGLVTYLPSKERCLFDDCRLDNFLAGEHTPRYGIHGISQCVGSEVSLFIRSVHADPTILDVFQALGDPFHLFFCYEELDKRLLKDVSPSGSPTVSPVFTGHGIDGRLGSNSPVPFVVQRQKRIQDGSCFWR
jgi:hypothetical protein